MAVSTRRLPLLAAALWAGAAAPPPACNATLDGVQMCMTRQVCGCAADAGGSLSGHAAGWRWHCDILAECDADQPASADSPGGPSAGPPWPGPMYLAPGMALPPR